MNINGINSYNKTTTDYAVPAKTDSTAAAAAKTATNTDKLEISSAAKNTATAGTYSKPAEKTKAADSDTIAKLKAESDRQINSFKQMLQDMLATQADKSGAKATGAADGKQQSVTLADGTVINVNMNLNLNVNYQLNIGTSTEVSGTDDYWGAEQTSQRLFDFAKALAGDNKELFETLRGAVQDGFSAVEGIFGGKGTLPQVSYDTYDLTMKKFDDYLYGDKTEAATGASAAAAKDDE